MAFMLCPTCERIGHVVARRHGPDLCPHCGDALPVRRTVVPISRYRSHERPATACAAAGHGDLVRAYAVAG